MARRRCCTTSSLHIPAGSSLAIVGPTGSGKTTLVNLISRLYEAPEGSLLIDGRPVREYPLAALRRNIGHGAAGDISFQRDDPGEPAFGAPKATAGDLLEAAEAAHVRQRVRGVSAGL